MVVHLLIAGALSPGLMPQIQVSLRASNPLCGSAVQVVDGKTTVSNGKYLLDVSWESGFCGFSQGTAKLSIRDAGETSQIDPVVGNEGPSFAELHEIDTLLCGEDRRFRYFGCTAVRTDGSSVIGNFFYIDPEKAGSEYHVDILEE